MQKMIRETEADIQRSVNRLEEIMQVDGEGMEESRSPFTRKGSCFRDPAVRERGCDYQTRATCKLVEEEGR